MKVSNKMKRLAKLISIALIFSMFSTCVYGVDTIYAEEADGNLLKNGVSDELLDENALIENLSFKEAMADEDSKAILTFEWDAISNDTMKYEAAIYTANEELKPGDVVADTAVELDKNAKSISFGGLSRDVLYFLQVVPYTEDEEGNKTYNNTKAMSVMGMYLSSPELTKVVTGNEITISLSSPTTVGTKKYIIEYTNGGTPITVITDKTTETIKGLDREKETNINVRTQVTVNDLEFKSSFTSIKEEPYFEKLAKAKLAIEPYNKGAILSWNAVKGATSYEVWRYYNKKWSKIKTLDGTKYTNTGLTVNKTYKYKVRAIRKIDDKKTIYGDYSDTLSIVAKVYLTGDIKMGYYTGKLRMNAKKYKPGSSTELASTSKIKVGTKITVLQRKKIGKSTMLYVSIPGGAKYWIKSGTVSFNAPYTTKDYTTQVKERFVNQKGYSSKTKYLLFICHYTQKVYLFQGKKGKWDLKATYKCAAGKASTRTPQGVYRIYKKASRTRIGSRYVSYFSSSNAFHARPAGSTTMSRPASNGCIRMYDKDAIYIYKNIPKNTTVVSY